MSGKNVWQTFNEQPTQFQYSAHFKTNQGEEGKLLLCFCTLTGLHVLSNIYFTKLFLHYCTFNVNVYVRFFKYFRCVVL